MSKKEKKTKQENKEEILNAKTQKNIKNNTEEQKEENSQVVNEEEVEEKKDVEEKTLSEEDITEKYIRTIAELDNKLKNVIKEFDNYRKRTLKEKEELILNGSEKAISSILPVIDDMERALASGEKTNDPNVLREGMALIHQKFIKVLASLGVSKIITEEQDFNVDYHEAVAMVPGMGDDKKGKVLDCVQTGYTLNDKVIRHAKVAVGQ